MVFSAEVADRDSGKTGTTALSPERCKNDNDLHALRAEQDHQGDEKPSGFLMIQAISHMQIVVISQLQAVDQYPSSLPVLSFRNPSGNVFIQVFHGWASLA